MPVVDPDELVGRLRRICAALPEVVEEHAWRGTRWRVRSTAFAHVLEVRDGRPRSYALAAGTDGPASVLTFRSAGPELAALGHAGPPFFKPPWAVNVVGLRLDGDSDWEEVAELLTESYCVSAPRKLVARVHRPG
ncbi:MmcQ/YjbR family DNA-binding protein [Saccharothrix syringae]|uniref:MmcQ/YjbR family DNA-binding protein n=1 Tax=Saccharothrix syringae TaxID=103733 RepID=A0A5Q0GZN0_SACSY|nr:MmcQ/YjbR family DNA-binding protein [Saccharothrix syringae]